MRNLVLLFIVVTLTFFSCDGRKSHTDALKDSVSEFNEKQLKIGIINYYPKEYSEVITDTLISNTTSIKIKNYTLIDDFVLLNKTIDNERVIVNRHRVFQSEIMISFSEKEKYSTKVNAKTFRLADHSIFWNNATLQHVWVNQEKCNTEKLNLSISFVDPKTNAYKLFQMTINRNGQEHIHLIEEHI